MTIAFYIVQLYESGNIGRHYIKKIDNQPEEGFASKPEAINHLKKLFKDGVWLGHSWNNNFIITEIYTPCPAY